MKLSDKLKKVISTVAPTLGTALGGPLGGLAGNMIADALGGPEKVEEALLKQNPEALLALKNAEQNFLLEMERLGIKLEEIEAADRASARELAKANMWPHISISVAFIIGYFYLLHLFFSGQVFIPQEYKGELTVLLGILTAAIPQILSFWLGSSSGSTRKTEMMQKGG